MGAFFNSVLLTTSHRYIYSLSVVQVIYEQMVVSNTIIQWMQMSNVCVMMSRIQLACMPKYSSIRIMCNMH